VVGTRGHHARAVGVGAENRNLDLAGVTIERRQKLACSRVPQLCRLIATRRHDTRTVGAERRRIDRLCVTGERADGLARSRVPDFGGFINTRRDHALAIGAKRSRLETARSREHRDQCAVVGSPDPGRTILARGHHALAVGAEGRSADAIALTPDISAAIELGDELAGPGVP
jgi:hypothetical protein